MRDITPEGYCMFSNPRDARRGGGVAIICKNGIICKMKKRNDIFESFEFLQLDVIIDSKRVSIFPIYRPEPNATTMNVFFNEFSDLLEVTSILSHHIIFLGDFNIHLDEKNNSNSMVFCDILASFNVVQHVGEATHESGHLLELVITRPTDFVSNVLVGDLFSDHKIVTFNLQTGKVLPEEFKVNSRNYKGIDMQSLKKDITSSFENAAVSKVLNLDMLVTSYDEILSDIIDKYAPLKTKFVQVRPKAPWMTSEVINERRIKRMLERRWGYRKTDESKKAFKEQMKKYKPLNRAHTEYYSNLVLENSNNPKSLFKVIVTLLNNKKKLPLPDHSSAIQLASRFGNLFMRKVLAIHEDLIGMELNRNLLPPVKTKRFQFTLNFFKQVSEDAVSKLIRKSPKKTCALDPIPT